jgi:uncharacterized protein YgfB (UPF0149 family)
MLLVPGGLNPAYAGTISVEGSRPITEDRCAGHFEEVRNDLLASGMLRDNLAFYKKQREEALKVIDATAEWTGKQRCDEIEEAQAKLEEQIEDAREHAESLVLMAHRDFTEQWCVKAAPA